MQLPPLNALRVFEVASRCTLFRVAAEELGVTPSAVGRQIKVLEDYLGIRLFERRHAAVQLTTAGRTYADNIRASLVTLEAATLELSRHGHRHPLRIWCSRTFMRQWLMPRLSSYREKHPEVNLVFSTSDGLRATDGGSVDLAIRLGDGQWPDSTATLLFETFLVPVCSPTYAAKHGLPKTPSDLLNYTLLQSLRRREDWATWLKSAGLGNRPIRKSMAFEGDTLAYQASLEGVGIALARRGFFEIDGQNGKIMTLLDDLPPAKAPGSYYVVHSSSDRLGLAARTFRSWILEQVEGSDKRA